MVACVAMLKVLLRLVCESDIFFIAILDLGKKRTNMISKFNMNKFTFLSFEYVVNLGCVMDLSYEPCLYNLKPTRNMGIHEQVGLFLYMSGKTISRHFHSVLNVLNMLAKDIIKPIDILNEIKNDTKYYPYFKDYIDAINGTHYEFVFLFISRHLILVRKAKLPLMSWLFVTLACVSPLFGYVMSLFSLKDTKLSHCCLNDFT
ncbi:hypothetical protein CR513_01740, partial [Mucuna pruriens]